MANEDALPAAATQGTLRQLRHAMQHLQMLEPLHLMTLPTTDNLLHSIAASAALLLPLRG
jgi:hypothetical protein